MNDTKDFTLAIYRKLLFTFLDSNYKVLCYKDFILSAKQAKKSLIIRHDVDHKPHRALRMANLEKEIGINSTYYFRDIPATFKPVLIREIAEMGHEIGYHYENMSKCHGNESKALIDFQNSLSRMKAITPISTISAHGGSLSRFDNLALWEKQDFQKYGIIADIVVSTDYTNILYLTDTGRSWNSVYNKRDKVISHHQNHAHTTSELITQCKNGKLPDRVIINIHPQRWANSDYEWHNEKILQAVKNKVKYYFFMSHKPSHDR